MNGWPIDQGQEILATLITAAYLNRGMMQKQSVRVTQRKGTVQHHHTIAFGVGQGGTQQQLRHIIHALHRHGKGRCCAGQITIMHGHGQSTIAWGGIVAPLIDIGKSVQSRLIAGQRRGTV